MPRMTQRAERSMRVELQSRRSPSLHRTFSGRSARKSPSEFRGMSSKRFPSWNLVDH